MLSVKTGNTCDARGGVTRIEVVMSAIVLGCHVAVRQGSLKLRLKDTVLLYVNVPFYILVVTVIAFDPANVVSEVEI